MVCKTCSIELTDLNAYKQKGQFRGWCKPCWQEYTKSDRARWAAKNKDRIAVWSLNRVHRFHFGGNREAVIQRDGSKCVQCGMSRSQHLEKYGRDITVDHKDGNGIGVKKEEKNNDMSNLQTLCLPCHTRKDKLRNKQELAGVTA